MVGKYNLGTRAGKCKVSVRLVGKQSWGPVLVDTNLGSRTGPWPEAKQRARGREIQTPY